MMRSHPLLRSTRRGWFLQADQGGGSGSSAAGGEGTSAADATPKVIDYKALLLQLLDLAPDADDATVQLAFEKEAAEPDVDIADLQAKASSAADIQAQLDAKIAEVNKAYSDMDALRKQQAEAQADDILKVYEGAFTDDASKAAIRAILINDRESGIAILNGLKKPEAAADPNAAQPNESTSATPPKPKHDPKGAAQGTSESDLAKKIRHRATEIQSAAKAKGKTISFQAAFAQAEKELKPAA